MGKKIRQVKQHFISLRVSEEQKNVIKKQADEVGYSMSEYVMSLVNGRHIKPRTPIKKEALIALNRATSNINQIAKKWNILSGDIRGLDIKSDLKEIYEMLAEVRSNIE